MQHSGVGEVGERCLHPCPTRSDLGIDAGHVDTAVVNNQPQDLKVRTPSDPPMPRSILIPPSISSYARMDIVEFCRVIDAGFGAQSD